MGRLRLFLGAAATLISAVALPATSQQPEDSTTERQVGLDNVVRVLVGGRPTGAGFIIGRQADVLWIATAAHVVFAEEDDEGATDARRTPRQGITLLMRGSSQEWSLAGPPQPGAGNDLAFVPFRVPMSRVFFDAWLARIIEGDPEPGARVRIAVTPSAIEYDAWDGEIVRSESDIAIDGLDRGRAGQSGAPVFGGRGFVGMYLSSAGERVLPMATIEAAARRANLPWQLQYLPARSASVHVCFEVQGAPVDAIRVNSDAGGVRRLDETGCASIASGRATLFVAGSVTHPCSPNRVTFSREPEQQLSIDCSPDLQGTWSSAAYGYVEISRVGEARWSFRGFDHAPFGAISGHLERVGQKLQVSARNGMNQQVIGELNYGAERLNGVLMVAGQRFEVEISR